MSYEADWGQVPINSVLLFQREVYHVIARGEGRSITLRHVTSGEEFEGHPHPGEEVTVLEPEDRRYVAPPEIEAAYEATNGLSDKAFENLAVALVQVTLGGHVVAEQNLDRPGAPQICPAIDDTLPDRYLAAHLYLFHDIGSDSEIDLAAAEYDRTMLLALHASTRARTAHRHRTPLTDPGRSA